MITILKIHKNTQGYPRKVTQLCHQLLLTMISENKTEISTEMVQRVISGKVNTGGLLQQKKKNYSEIAVNKLLDVLRKDQPDKEDQPEPVFEDGQDDDWIGGGKEQPVPEQEIEETKQELDPVNTPEQNPIEKPIVTDSKDETVDQPVLNPTEDVLPRPGKYPSNIPPK